MINSMGSGAMLDYSCLIWPGVIILAFVLELVTAQLVSVWFIAGGLVALVVSLFVDNFLLQVIVFFGVTAVTLILTRPFVERVLKFKKTSTNADRVIGQEAIVIKDIDDRFGQGQVSIHGEVWSARSIDGQTISVGENVRIQRIEGIKVLVEKI